MAKSIHKLSIFAILALFSAQAQAINYDDPNLSGRRDVVARAALSCNTFRGMREQFDACLVSHGVTDMNEKSEAASIAKAVPPSAADPSVPEEAPATKSVRPALGAKRSK